MSIKVSVIRAFTDDLIPALGNPAGVVMTSKTLSEEVMQSVAIDARQPITAFVVPRMQKNEFDIRYYDLGGRECHICGHATVAATAFLARECLRHERANSQILP